LTGVLVASWQLYLADLSSIDSKVQEILEKDKQSSSSISFTQGLKAVLKAETNPVEDLKSSTGNQKLEITLEEIVLEIQNPRWDDQARANPQMLFSKMTKYLSKVSVSQQPVVQIFICARLVDLVQKLPDQEETVKKLIFQELINYSLGPEIEKSETEGFIKTLEQPVNLSFPVLAEELLLQLIKNPNEAFSTTTDGILQQKDPRVQLEMLKVFSKSYPDLIQQMTTSLKAQGVRLPFDTEKSSNNNQPNIEDSK
jgi:hypothetical protein